MQIFLDVTYLGVICGARPENEESLFSFTINQIMYVGALAYTLIRLTSTWMKRHRSNSATPYQEN
jgi:type IV secretory pathway TrbL component